MQGVGLSLIPLFKTAIHVCAWFTSSYQMTDLLLARDVGTLGKYFHDLAKRTGSTVELLN